MKKLPAIGSQLSATGLKFGHPSDIGLTRIARIRDLWAHAGRKAGAEYSADVASHGVVMLKVQGR